jgi:hypothetical protein
MRRPKAKAVKRTSKGTKKRTAKAAKRNTATKKAAKKAPKPSKAKKAKKAARKTVANFEADMTGGPLGCCTLSGNGPNIQFEGVTHADCRQRALERGKIPHWWPGKCAEPG